MSTEGLMNPLETSHSSVDQIFSLPIDLQAEQADLLLLKGETSLLKGDLTGLTYFEQASQIAPENPSLYFRQGISLFEYGCHENQEKALHLALKKFKIATKLHPEFFEAWNAWGTTLTFLGNLSDQMHYFLQAKEKFDKALLYAGGQSSDILADLYWGHAVCWAKLSVQSGEPHDGKIALHSFEKASGLQQRMPAEFWNDYGCACLALGKQSKDARFLWKAEGYLKKAVHLSITSFASWASLARGLSTLYHYTSDEELISQTLECFSAAIQIRSCEELLLEWADFLKNTGKQKQDPKHLRLAIEKASLITHPDKQAKAMSIASDALAFLGLFTERLDLMHQAEEQIASVCEQEERNGDLWYAYGQVLTAFGTYFGDGQYYDQAIEKFQRALSLDRTNHHLWFAIAESYKTVAIAELNPRAFHRSRRFYGKAIDLHPSSAYLFAYAQMLSSHGESTHGQKWLEEALKQFQRLFAQQKSPPSSTSPSTSVPTSIHWLFTYAATLDMVGDFYEEESYYAQAIELFSLVLSIDPDYPQIHHRIALAHSHLGDLSAEADYFYKAVHHYRLAEKRDPDNEHIILDWAITLMNIARHTFDEVEAQELYGQAEHKLHDAARLGNINAHYHLACLYSLLGNFEQSLFFIKRADHFFSLPPIEEMLHDEWLDGVRATASFRDFLAELENRPE